MCLAQGPQGSDAGEARTRGPSVSKKYKADLLGYLILLKDTSLHSASDEARSGDPSISSRALHHWDHLFVNVRPDFFYWLIYGKFFTDLGSGDENK